MEIYTIEAYRESYKNQLLAVWENSVLATHDFLTPSDFEEIKTAVASIDFNDLPVFCLIRTNSVLGFVGVAGRRIEMLFLDPEYFGLGLGKKLLHYAIKELHANQVDVNEQNIKAVDFYQKFGFKPFERTAQDDQGRNYPLLRMKLI